MPRVHFDPLGRSADTRRDETVLDAARRAGVPVANACGGVGACNRCNVIPLEGRENLNEPTPIERALIDSGKLSGEQRLACQTVVRGECRVTTTYWG